MPNMSPKKVPMPEQDPNVRIKNFLEVALGYTEQMAMEDVKIPEFVQLIAQGKFEEAYNKIRETNNLPAICGRVCPQENQCEKFCVRGIKGEPVAIGRLEKRHHFL